MADPIPFFALPAQVVQQQIDDMAERADVFQEHAIDTIQSLTTLQFDAAITPPQVRSATVNIPARSLPDINPAPVEPIDPFAPVSFEMLLVDDVPELERTPEFRPTGGMPAIPEAPRPTPPGPFETPRLDLIPFVQDLELEPRETFAPTTTLPNIPEPPSPTEAAMLSVDFEMIPFDGTLDLENPGPFTPTTQLPSLPEPPSPIVVGQSPSRPPLHAVTLPDAPALVYPEIDLLPFTLPDFTFPLLPEFSDLDPGEPEFTGVQPNTQLLWAETPYNSQLLSDVINRIRTQLLGGTGLPAAVEAALFARARSRDDEQAGKAMQESVDKLAASGHELPSGTLAAQINATIDANRLAAQATNRDILIQASQLEQENLKNAVAQGIALETVLIAQHNNVVERSFQAAKARLDAEVQLYNFAVALFNAKQSARSIAADVYRTTMQGALAHLDEFRARIDAAKAVSEFNSTQAQVFGTRMEALRRTVEIYGAQMDAARVQSDIERIKIEGWRGEVDAWAQTLNVRRIEWESYKTRVEAEATKAGMYEAEARAFAATVDAANGRNNTKVAVIQQRVQAMQASVGLYEARVREQNQRASITVENARNEWAGYNARLSAESTKAGTYESEVRAFAAMVAASDGRNNTQVAVARAKVDAIQASVSLFNARVQQEATRIGVEQQNVSNEWEAYKARVAAEAAKANIIEAEARAFAAEVGATDGRNQTRIALARTKVDALQASVGLFDARVREEGQRSTTQVEIARARTATFQADVARFSAEVSADNADRALRVQANEADLRNNIALVSVLSDQWQAAQQLVFQRSALQSEAVKAAGAMAAQLAAGCYSAMHVQASIGSNANASETHSYDH